MLITIELKCPQCHRGNIVRKGKKAYGPWNYLCKDCGRQFIADHEKTYGECLSGIAEFIKIMLVRGVARRDISAILRISVTNVLKVLTSGVYTVQPKERHYTCLEIDEFWTYIGERRTKSGSFTPITGKRERLWYAWGKRDLKTAKKLRKRLIRWELPGIR